MAVCDLNISVGSQPLDPATHIPLMEMQYNNKVLEDEFAKAGALNFFSPEVDPSWTNDLSIHQSIRVKFKDYQNPFTQVAITDIEYEDGENCPPVMSSQCDPGCISSENSWRTLDVRFKNKFRIGVSWCVEEEKLLYQDAESRFQESVDSSKVVTSTVGWSELVCQAIATPATTMLPAFRNIFATHYFDANTADVYDTLTQVFNYMQRLYGSRWLSEFAVIADPQLELDLLDHDGEMHAYNATGIATANGNTDIFAAGGFIPMPSLPKLWNKPIMIAPDVVDYYPTTGPLAGRNLNPFASADGNRYYVVIASKRSFFHGQVTLMDKKHFPATCDNKNESIQQTWISFYQLLFPKEVFIVAFDRPGGATAPAPAVTAATPSGAAQGTTVTVSGSNLAGTTSVTMGGVAASYTVAGNGSTVYVTVPAGTAGSAPIVVTTTSGASNSLAYTRGA